MQHLLFDEDADRIEGHKNRVLSLLQERPHTNMELVKKATHRFSASINQLRIEGHKIITKPMTGGMFKYIYISFERKEKTKGSIKQRYYSTPHWKRKRVERLEFDNYRCCHCKGTQDLHVHHWFYELFEEDIEDLSTLCKQCHEKIHSYPNISIHFPTAITIEHANMIKGDSP